MTDQSFYQVAKILGDSWVLVILVELSGSALRFNQLKEMIPDISSRTLSFRLKSLVEQGILSKNCPENNRNFCEYSLTKKGKKLCPVIMAIQKVDF